MGVVKEKIERVPTYINGLDKEIEGGIPKGFVNLICGVAGSMKSSMVFNIIYNEALNGKNAFYVSVEQPYDNLSMHLSNLGLDLSKVNVALAHIDSSKLDFINKAKNAGTIIFLDVPSVRQKIIRTRKFGDLIALISDMINNLEKRLKYDYFVLDSLNALYSISEIKKLRETLFNVFDFLRSKKLTSYLILEVSLDEGLYKEYEVENYLADSVIFLDLAHYDRAVQREISVAKMRATKSNINVFTLSFDKGKFRATYGGEIPVVDLGEGR